MAVPLTIHLNVGLFFGAFVLLVLGAEIFTNSVEWLGHHLGVSEGATGSILAAVGTALPETMIPVIAILQVQLGTGDQAAADEVGVGAILGAPFMLATIAMFLLGSAVLYYGSRRQSGTRFTFSDATTNRDIRFFLLGYPLAVVAAFVDHRAIELGIAVWLVALYLFYVYRTLSGSGEISGHDLEGLHLVSILSRAQRPFPGIGSSVVGIRTPPLSLVIAQSILALGIIIAGAHLFVTEVEVLSEELFTVPPAVVALLLAPLATELPEKLNSVIWVAQDKDTLAMGNITGAMVFQGTLPVTLGIVYTSWDLSITWGTVGFLNTFSASLAIFSAVLLSVYLWRSEPTRIHPIPFLLGGALYGLFIVVVVYHVVVLGVTATPH